MTLVEFPLARIAEDERVATVANQSRWRAEDDTVLDEEAWVIAKATALDEHAVHIARSAVAHR